ncbi:HET-domain-containing protein, partial [Macroventuria anomochaeta]
IALSYCWGGPQPITTRQDNAQDHTNGIVFSELPKTLQDAIFVTSELGMRYLWVDCLCIIQDDPEDVAREISLMAQIFEQAYVSISAASAASVHEGFLANQNAPVGTAVPVTFNFPDSDMTPLLIERVERTRDPANDPINLRAWTLQEHILAPRMLVYSTEELWWQCESSVTHSKGQEEDLYYFSSKLEKHRRSLDYWRSIVQDYSRRFLTYSNDKLPALAGIAARFSRTSSARYFAGLWDIDLLGELMWCSSRSDISRPATQRAPSWSWASVDGEVH